jgi:hypothetical protein
MRALATIIGLCIAEAMATSCGYFAAGTWTNDPRNWERAFDSKQPHDVVVVHSEYTRFPHWSYEFRYCFEIAANSALQEQLMSRNKLRRIDDREVNGVQQTQGNPSWFLPKDSSQYDGWVFDGDPNRNFRVLIDRESGAIYLSDRQL